MHICGGLISAEVVVVVGGGRGAEGVHQSAVCSEASASPALTLSGADVVFDNVMCLACSYDFFFR